MACVTRRASHAPHVLRPGHSRLLGRRCAWAPRDNEDSGEREGRRLSTREREMAGHHRPVAGVKIIEIGDGGRKRDSPQELLEDSRCAKNKRALEFGVFFSSRMV
jgi:hypothetical protein